MSHELTAVTDAEFQAAVLDAPHPVLVEFTAAWCPPCQAIKPALQELAVQYRGKASIVTVDVDANHASTMKYGVRAMPTLLVFKNGQVVKQLVGAANKTKLEGLLTSTLG